MLEAETKAKAPTWVEAHEMEARAMQERVSLILKKIGDLSVATKDENLLGMSEAEREAKKAAAKEERVALLAEFHRLAPEVDKVPDYSGMSEAERAAEAERMKQQAMEKARSLKLEGNPYFWLQERVAAVVDFDPKQGGRYYNRFHYADYPEFDLDDESPLGPMRFTDTVYETNRFKVCEAVNILSVKIACSDVGFPIQVYGTVIARDSIDHVANKHMEFPSSILVSIRMRMEDEPLILTGPKRGLVLFDDNYVETNLKIMDHEGQDRELSKGILMIRGLTGPLNKCEVERRSVATRLSTVDVMYAVVERAVEATITVRVLPAEFDGIITAHTTSIQERLVLYDSKVAGDVTGDGVIQLMRSVVSVNVKDMLIIEAKTHRGETVRNEFTPRGNKERKVVSTLGAIKMRMKVAWSIMDP
ncbi:hypothetical protein EJB05_34465 [Eragrostis curvula]|uniref:DUF6598 domain-containing protein n=1 Tax=Eragrostis curvula TaxID=38414 RepID=A0A5J9U469_9POAL|nr:hypothetical protein EJB05_34465 [Eragrostis curvula]